MWKIFFEYKDKSKVTLTGKKNIHRELLIKYWIRYGIVADKAIFQQYPKKEHEPINLIEKISAEFGGDYAEKMKEIQRQVLVMAEGIRGEIKCENQFQNQ